MIKGIGINTDCVAIDGNLQRLDEHLARYEALGFDAVELMFSDSNAICGGFLRRSILEREREVTARRRLRYTMHAPCPLDLTRNVELAEKILESCLEMAATLGAEVLVYHSAQHMLHDASHGLGPLPTEEQLAEHWRIETEALVRWGRRCEELGVVLAVENRSPHRWDPVMLARNGRPASEVERYHQGIRLDLLAAQVAEVGSRYVGMCLDVGHAHLASLYWGGMDFLTGIRACAPQVVHVHFQDNWGRVEDMTSDTDERMAFGEGDTHLPPGWGVIPLRKVLEVLAGVGYSGWILAEMNPRYEHDLPEVLESTRACCREAGLLGG